MSQRIHDTFLETAESISTRLYDAIVESGPCSLRKRRDLPLPDMLCRAVAGQQLSTKAASTIWKRVVELCDQTPVAEFALEADPLTLRQCGLSSSKTKAIQAIAQAYREGQLEEDVLNQLATDDRSARLTQIWGVGQWTADMINMFYFGDKDVWPAGDLTVWKTLERLTDKRRNHNKTAAKFAPKRTYLALYMYAIADRQT